MRSASLLLVALLLTPVAAAEPPVPDYVVPEAIEEVRPDHPELVSRLVAEVVQERVRDSQEAWRVLSALGPSAVPEVIRALPGASWYGRTLLMAALAESGVSDADPVLVAGAADPSWAVREMAAYGLGRARKEPVGEALLGLLDDPSWRVRSAAATALRRQTTLGRCDAAATIEALLVLAADPEEDRDVRIVATAELDLLAADARELYLTGYEQDEDEELRDVCFRALTRLPGAEGELAEAMRNALRRSEEPVFLEAAEKYVELTGARILENEAHTARLLRLLRTRYATQTAKVWKEIGREAVPVLLNDLWRFWTRRAGPTQVDLSQTILNLVERILSEDAAPVLEKIIREWEMAEPARRYAVVLARRYHAAALAKTFKEIYDTEGVRDIQATLIAGLAAAGDPELPRFLESAILSGNLELQRAARRILENRPDIDLSDALIAAIEAEEHNQTIARDLLQLLVARRSPAAFAQASRLLSHRDPDFREVGADWIRFQAKPEEVLKRLTAAFKLEKGRVRDPNEPPSDDEDRIREERRQVIRAILQSARATAGEAALPLMAIALADDDAIVREKALREIGRIRSAESLRMAVAALAVETDPAARHEARKVVVAYDTPQIAKLVESWLESADEEVLGECLRALEKVEVAPVPGLLLTALAEGCWEPEARVRAVQILASRKNPDHLEVLLELITSDPNREVRSVAVEAAAEIGSPLAAPALVGLLPREGEDLRDLGPQDRDLAMQAIQALGTLGVREPALLDLLRREWPLAILDATTDRYHFEAVSLIATALGRIKDPSALPLLLGMLLSPDLYRPFALLEAMPSRRERNLLGDLLAALVRFPDEPLDRAGRDILTKLRGSGDAYRIDEGYLIYVAGILTDPRMEIGRPQPRRGLATELYELVLEVVPRESGGDLTALRWLTSFAAGEGRFGEAATLQARENELQRLLEPREFEENEEMYLSREDFYAGLSLMDAGDDPAGLARYRAGLERDPEEPDILNLYAWWLADTGRHLPEALEAALAAGRRSGSDPNVLDTLAWALHRLGRHQEALARMTEAAEIERRRAVDEIRGPDALILYHLAAIQAAAGLLDESAEMLLTVVSKMDDTYAATARASADFEPLRQKGLLDPLLRMAERALSR